MSTADRTRGRRIGDGNAPDDTVDLSMVMGILRRQWWIVVLLAGLFLGLGVTYVVMTPKTWRTSTRVLLDPREKQIVGNDVARPQQSTELGWVETRLELVKSYANLAEVVKKEKLFDDPEIMGHGARSEVPDEQMSVAVRTLSEMILVERPKENNLIDVTVTSRSPEKAARLSQAVAEAFVVGLVQAKVDQIEHAHALLTKQADVQRKAMLDAEVKVEDYKRSNGIAVTRGNLVDEETLRQSNENLVSAHVKAQEAKERWERLKQVLKSGDPAFHSQLDSVGSAVIGRLKIDAAQAARRKTEIELEYGPLHPKARAAAAEAERGKGLLLAEVASLAATAEMDWQLAKSNEDNVRRNLDRAQSRLADTTQATVGLQELENDANARRDLYKSFVARIQETTLQKSTQVSDATIVSPAQVPLKPFSPRVGLALLLSLVAGLGVGISAALFRGRAVLLRTRRTEPTFDTAPPPPAAVVVPSALVEAEIVAPVVPRAEDDHTVAAPAGDPSMDPGVAIEPETMRPASVGSSSAHTPARVDLTLMPERIARLGAPEGPGSGATAALVETPEGSPDYNGLAMLRRLADELGHVASPEIRVLFSNDVPTLVTAALAHGLARASREAGRRVLLVDLSAETGILAPAFDAASAMPRPNRRRANAAFDLRLDDHDVVFARPREDSSTDDRTMVDPARRADRLTEFLHTAARDYDDVVVHLGCAPVAALLFDIAETADHMVLVVDEKEIATRRVQGEIDVMAGLMPHFDGIVVLRVAPMAAEGEHRDERRRRRRG